MGDIAGYVFKGWDSQAEERQVSLATQRCAKSQCAKIQLPSWLLTSWFTIKCHKVKHGIAVREAKLELGVRGFHSSSFIQFGLRPFQRFEQRSRPGSLFSLERGGAPSRQQGTWGLKRHCVLKCPLKMAERHFMFLGIMGNRSWVVVRAMYTFHQKSKTCKQTDRNYQRDVRNF